MALETALPQTFEAPAEPSEQNRRSWIRIVIVTLVLAIAPAVLWPGAITWFWDPPVLVGEAYFFNQDHALASRGLGGNFGIPYGPLATQMYQVMLLFTRDTRVMVVMHAVLFAGVLAAAFLSLARSLRLSIWFGIAILLSPYLSWTERELWDATCAIPVGVVTMAAYAAFLRSGRGVPLAMAMAGATLGPFIHMQGLPLFFAVVGHACWRHWRSMLRYSWLIVLALVPVVISSYRYGPIFIEFVRAKWPDMIHKGYHDRGNMYLASMLGPFTSGGQNFIGDNWVVTTAGLPGPSWLSAPKPFFFWPNARPFDYQLCYPAQISYIAMGLAWAGMLAAAVQVVRTFVGNRRAPGSVSKPNNRDERRSLRYAENPDSASSNPALRRTTSETGVTHVTHSTVRDTSGQDVSSARSNIMLICLAALFMQIGLAAVLRLPSYPQYSYGTWPIHLLFAWFGVDLLRRVYLAQVVTVIYGLAVLYLTVGGTWSVHNRGWVRDMNSPTMEDQIPIARQLDHYVDPIVYTDVPTFQIFPRTIQVLRLLHPPTEPAVSDGVRHRLYLRYQHNGDPSTQRVELMDLGNDPDFDAPGGIPILSSALAHIAAGSDGAIEIDVNPPHRWY